MAVVNKGNQTDSVNNITTLRAMGKKTKMDSQAPEVQTGKGMQGKSSTGGCQKIKPLWPQTIVQLFIY